MFLTHQPLSGGHLLLFAHHSKLGFVEDAQGYIFVSGLMVGLIYGRRMMKRGFTGGAWVLWRRAAQIYVWAMGCVVAIVVMRNILPGGPEAIELGPLDEVRVDVIVATVLLMNNAWFSDILIQYFVYMLVAPPLLWLCLT